MNGQGQKKNSNNDVGFAMSLREAAAALDATMIGDDVMLHGVSTDSRRLKAGQLFVALSGPNFDGHAFATQVCEDGAAACILEHAVAQAEPALLVADTRQALGSLARYWREKFTLPVVAVTGSNGKTTVKEMLAGIFARQGAVMATEGNLNNDIGVPLTLFRLDARHNNAVVEMGANHAGEIAYLTDIARPTVAVITNAAAAHLEGFGSLEGVARAKGEIFSGLPEDGVAIINADDAYADLWRELAGPRRALSFGLNNPADVHAVWPADDKGHVTVNTPVGNFDLSLPLPGRHNLMNALAATAAALAAGASLEDIRQGLEAMQAVPGRLQFKAGVAGSRIIDDAYNANPASITVALSVLCDCPGVHLLALGDMGELGETAEDLHRQTGLDARAAGVDKLFSLGELARAAGEAFGEQARAYASHAEMIEGLREELSQDVTLLVKGSRRMHMEKIVDALTLSEEVA